MDKSQTRDFSSYQTGVQWPPDGATEFELEVTGALLTENIVGVEHAYRLALVAIRKIDELRGCAQ